MKDEIKLILPDFLNTDVCNYLMGAVKNHPQIIKENVTILGFYGGFPGCNWNEKNKKFDMYKLDEKILKGLKSRYNTLKVSLFIIFDKDDIDEDDLDDEYGNLILNIFNDEKNYLIIKSDILKEYVKNKFKKFNFVSEINNLKYASEKDSFILNIDDFDKKELFKNKLNKNFIIRNGNEFIENHQNLFKHSKSDSKLHKINPKKNKYYNNSNDLSFYKMRNSENYLNYESMKKFVEEGINQFILPGLGVYNFAAIENIIDLIYKEEYKTDARIEVFQKIFALKEQECNEIFNYRL